jgi:single-stranded-DNA-specific exonuclease
LTRAADELTHTVRAWLNRSGALDAQSLERYLEPRLSDLTAPDKMVDRSTVARRLADAVRRGERIVVFGDYDCDGITSAVLLTEVLQAFGARVRVMLASRFDGGYGVSPAAQARIEAAGCDLLVTCDCGSSDHAAFAALSARGIAAIVIDHHLVPSEPLPVLGFLNPHRPECGFGYKGLASCGLVLSVAAALRREISKNIDLRDWLDLVAIGTVADVAPLDGDNRSLVRAGLKALREGRRPGLKALFDAARVSRRVPLTGRDLAFRVAPLLNAPGRLGAPDLAAELLMERSPERAAELAAKVLALSDERRAVQAEILAQAEAEISEHGYDRDAAIVVGRQGWNAGIVGIVAGRLADRLKRPVVVVGFDGSVGRGSVRGPSGSRLYDALARCADVVVRFGGHQQAAGLEVEHERLPALRAAFIAAVLDLGAPNGAPAPEPLELDARDDPASVLADLDRVEPCGAGNPRPLLRAVGNLESFRVVGEGHLKFTLKWGELRLAGFAPNQPAAGLRAGHPVTVLGDLRHSDFPGASPVEFFAEALTAH